MGVSEYICFIQRNGQNVTSLVLGESEPNRFPVLRTSNYTERIVNKHADCGKAIVVLVPGSYSLPDILSFELKDFRKFEYVKTYHNWDTRQFKGIKGYYDVLMENPDDNAEWWEYAVWTSLSFPGYWLVNFEFMSYHVFVRFTDKIHGKSHRHMSDKLLDLIPMSFFEEIFGNRSLPCPESKRDAFNEIQTFGKYDLKKYHDKNYQYNCKYITVEHEYHEVKRNFLKKDIIVRLCSGNLYNYTFTKGVLDKKISNLSITPTRFNVLVGDYIPKGVHNGCELLKPELLHKWYKPNGKELNETFNLYYTFRLKIDLDNDDISGCLKCKKRRWIESLYCYEHKDIDYIEEYIMYIKRIYDELMKNINILEESIKEIPTHITITFEEKELEYIIDFNLVE